MASFLVVRANPTLHELTLEKMRGAILNLHFKAGERLIERKLCDELGVSRTVVREVLRHLEAEGLVTMLPHQGPVVAQIDSATAGQIYKIRGALESMAARALVHRDDRAAVVAQLEDAVDAIESALSEGDLRRSMTDTARFYELLFIGSGMTVAWEIIRNLNARINSLRALTLSAYGRTKSGPEDMRRIVRAVSAGDADAAEAACKMHVDHAYEILKEVLKDRNAAREVSRAGETKS